MVGRRDGADIRSARDRRGRCPLAGGRRHASVQIHAVRVRRRAISLPAVDPWSGAHRRAGACAPVAGAARQTGKVSSMNALPPDDLPPLPDTPPGRYRHYKGGEYEVLGAARHSETLEPLVVYRPLYNASGWWVRPHAMFFGTVVADGVERARFQRQA